MSRYGVMAEMVGHYPNHSAIFAIKLPLFTANGDAGERKRSPASSFA